MRRIKPHREFMGRTIYYQAIPGRLPWYTINPNFAADTLEGIKQLIHEDADTLAVLSSH